MISKMRESILTSSTSDRVSQFHFSLNPISPSGLNRECDINSPANSQRLNDGNITLYYLRLLLRRFHRICVLCAIREVETRRITRSNREKPQRKRILRFLWNSVRRTTRWTTSI